MVKENKNPIYIKKSHEGRFTEYCEGKGYDGVTSGCIDDGLASKLLRVRKMANFANNARKWEH